MKQAVAAAVVAFALALEGALIVQLAATGAAPAPSAGRMLPSHLQAAGPCVAVAGRKC